MGRHSVHQVPTPFLGFIYLKKFEDFGYVSYSICFLVVPKLALFELFPDSTLFRVSTTRLLMVAIAVRNNNKEKYSNLCNMKIKVYRSLS